MYKRKLISEQWNTESHLLLKYSNNVNDVNFLYQNVFHKRTICSLFPFKSHKYVYHIMSSDYIELIKRYDLSKNEKLLKFYILFNGIVNVFVVGDGSKLGEFDYWLHKQDNKDIWVNGSYGIIFCEILLTGICGITVYEGTGGNYNKSDLSDAILNVKRLLFNNDLTQLKKLSKLSAKYVKAKITILIQIKILLVVVVGIMVFDFIY